MVDAELGVEDQVVEFEEVDSSDDAYPLLIFYDCETTGLGIYNDHITDIAAKVVACPVPLSSPTFSSLVKTSRHIPAVGKAIYFYAVLVAHNGYAFDFPILLAEVERRPTQLAIANMEARNVHFCDTLPFLRKVSISDFGM